MNEIYCVRRGKTIKVKDICTTSPTTTLVSKIKKEREKPVKNLLIANLDKEQAKVQAVAEMSRGKLSSLSAATCLYQIGLKTTGGLDSPWVTYGRTLTTPAHGRSEAAAALANIACPMTLIDLKTTVSTKDYETAGQSAETDLTTKLPVSVEEDWKVLLAVVAYYRLSSIEAFKFDYINTLLNSAIGLLHLKPGQNWLGGAGTSNLASDQDVNMLMALWDMFFQKFPKHQLSKARWGTQITRYKDCGLLETLKRTANSFGWSWSDLAPWAFRNSMAEEFKALLDTDDEIDDDYGYLPYQSSLGLVDKSPYSANANPNIHLFCKMFFAMRKDNYGYNAVALECAQTHDAITCAFLLVLAHGSRKKTLIMSTTSGSHEAKNEVSCISEELPTTQKAEDWILWFQRHNGSFPAKIRQQFLQIIADAKKRGSRNRKGSVGEKLAQYILT